MSEVRVALVTGGGSGIGAACALKLADQGFQVMVNGRTESKLRAVTSGYENMRYFVGDIAKGDLAERLVYFTWGQFGRVDVLIHAAGVFVEETPVSKINLQQWDEVIKMNVTGTFLISQAVGQIMRQHQRSGQVIIVSSLAGLWQCMLGGRMAYNAANAAKIAIAVTYNLDMQPLTSCRAIAACFGLVDTPMVQPFLASHPEFRDQALGPTEAADYLYQLIQNPPACPVVTITKQKGICEATHLVWQTAPSIE